MNYEYLMTALVVMGVGVVIGKHITRYYFSLEEWEAERKETLRLLRKIAGEPEEQEEEAETAEDEKKEESI